MPYIALKPCVFGGVKYKVNDLIPDEVIAKPKKLVDAKTIAPQKADIKEAVNNTGSFMFPMLSDGELTEIDTTIESLSTALIILQKSSDDATDEINKSVDEDMLFMVSALESRKTVKSAADKRLKAVNGQGDE